MSFKGLFYAYVVGGLTFIPLVLLCLVFITVYTSVPISEVRDRKKDTIKGSDSETKSVEAQDAPRSRKGWLTVRRTFEESPFDGTYVTLVRTFLDARSKDPKKSRPKDMWYVVMKGKVLYLYEDEEMTECEAVIELGSYQVRIYPEGQLDGELFAKRNAIQLKPTLSKSKYMPSLSRDMKFENDDLHSKLEELPVNGDQKGKIKEGLAEDEMKRAVARDEGEDSEAPWFIFVRSTVEMEDWYLSLIHASEQLANTSTLQPLRDIFLPSDMDLLVSALHEQPDVIPMRWFNALFGRVYYSFYRTEMLESFIINRIMKKLSKVKRPAFLTDILVNEVTVGNRTPTFSKPMLKELTKEGDASMEVHMQFRGEIRVTVEATAIINLGARFKSYTVKLVLAVVLKELEGNLLLKIKRPPSNRIWYAFTQTPRMVLQVEPVVSDRQITWSMILSTIEARLKEIVQESVVLPNMDDIAFFDTLAYQHRGGIWPETSRRTTESAVADAETSSSQTEPPILLASEEGLQRRSQTLEMTHTNDLAPSATTDFPPQESSSLSVSSDSTNRRRTWQADDESGFPDVFQDEDTTHDTLRGRSLDPDRAHSHRSHSTPQETGSSDDHLTSDDSIVSPSFSKSQPSSRRSSQHISSSGHAASQSFDDRSFKAFGESSMSPSKNTRQTLAENTASFLSTLKSRAADKQALSNSAKEAMRKWGVNWGPAKKDSEDIPDQDGVSHRLSRPDDGGSISKGRASYAEVRAAVAERKGKSRSNLLEDLPHAEGSSPITISKNRTVSGTESDSDRDPSIISGASSAPSTDDGSGSRSGSNDNVDAKDLSISPIHVQPQAKTMSIPRIHASHRGEVMSLGYNVPHPAPLSPENRSKNPVYRFWKSPTTTQTLSVAADGSSAGVSDQDEEKSIPFDLPSISQMRSPPPLPPRRTPTSATLPSLRSGTISGPENGHAAEAVQDHDMNPQGVSKPSDITLDAENT